MYLYIFEDGTARQASTPPTQLDRTCISDGILSVIRLNAGVFEELRESEKWEPVDPTKIETNSEGDYHML